MNRWPKIYIVAWSALLALAAIGAAVLFLPRYHRHRMLQAEKSLLQKENLRQEALVRELRENQRRFETDPDFVERMARERGMVKADEKTFRISASNTPLPPAD
jgi:cell division protein FtsB